MRKIIFKTFLLFCLSFVSSYGQLPLKYGVDFGVTSSNQSFNFSSNDKTREYDYKTGFKCGIFGEFMILPYLNIIGEVSYIQKGTQDKNIIVTRIANNEQGYEDIGYLNLRYDYIAVSTLAKGKYELGFITPYLVFGPNINYLVDGNEQADFDLDKFNKFVFGYSAGLGTDINVHLPFSFLIELLYSRDITNAYKDEVRNIKNYSLEFIIGVTF